MLFPPSVYRITTRTAYAQEFSSSVSGFCLDSWVGYGSLMGIRKRKSRLGAAGEVEFAYSKQTISGIGTLASCRLFGR